jgi:ABC-type multidrug transport system ATPase subunit
MKTLSFHNFKVGRSPSQVLIGLNTETDGLTLRSGLNLIVAPNGYGKTTLLQTLANVLNPLGGDIYLDGKTLNSEKHVLYVSEYLTFPKFIYPTEWISYVAGGSNDRLESLKAWVEGFSLQKKMGTFLGRMSQGERRKVTWLGAQASEKSVLLLDEPLDGLDLLAIRTAREMVETWKKEGRIVCIVAHQVGELLDLTDEIFLIQDSRLISMKKEMSVDFRTLGAEDFRKKIFAYYRP